MGKINKIYQKRKQKTKFYQNKSNFLFTPLGDIYTINI